MKCSICGKPGVICFSAWPDAGEYCLCEEHITESHLWKIQKSAQRRAQSAFRNSSEAVEVTKAS